jgi:CubicO group peptidase (beta-lactamase class C family)
MFRIGSVTKQFTAAAIMRFVEEGKLALDDELATFIPDFPLQGHTVTIRHLLNHTSGIPSYTDLGEEWQKLWPLNLTHEEMLALVKDKPFDFAPGEKWAYNNTAYYMLGMIIEHISGTTYADHMQNEFFTPLGLDRTRYDITSDIIKNRARGYGFRNDTITNAPPLGMSQPFAAGSLLSTSEELVEWSIALTTGKVVAPESFTQMTTPAKLADGETTDYGFGLQLEEFEGQKSISHGGGIHGFNSMLIFLPDADIHIAVISNGPPVNAGRIAREIGRAALGIEMTEVKHEPVTPELMKKVAGNYTLEEIGMDCTVWEEDGKAMLTASAEGQVGFELLWQGADVNGGNEFRADFDHEVKIVFAEDGQSFTLHQGGGKALAKRSAE